MFIAEVFESAELLYRGERADHCRPRLYETSATTTRSSITAGMSFSPSPFSSSRCDPAVMHRIMQENLSWRGGSIRGSNGTPAPARSSRRSRASAPAGCRSVRLKGFRHGDAQISHIHANIMVNLGKATAKDVRELISIAQSKVEERFGQHLEPEIGFIGEF